MMIQVKPKTLTFRFDRLYDHAQQIAGECQECQCGDADLEERLNLTRLAVPRVLHHAVSGFSLEKHSTSSLITIPHEIHFFAYSPVYLLLVSQCQCSFLHRRVGRALHHSTLHRVLFFLVSIFRLGLECCLSQFSH